jgi:hypothetical protein
VRTGPVQRHQERQRGDRESLRLLLLALCALLLPGACALARWAEPVEGLVGAALLLVWVGLALRGLARRRGAAHQPEAAMGVEAPPQSDQPPTPRSGRQQS